MDDILKRVKSKIIPTKKEAENIENVMNILLSKTDTVIKPMGLQKTIAGSLLRDTWLRDKKEIDLFILFPTTFKRERLESLGLEIGKKIMKRMGGKSRISYAEHPYVKGEIDGYSIDIVPCYKVESASKIISAVDRTPFHNKYLEKTLLPEMSGEVRLLKQFCKSCGVYGSDEKTRGFSGYLCELLIIRYKNFKNLVLETKGWDPGIRIDIEGHGKIKDTKKHYRSQPLIVIDPTDPKRNVAAALSPKNFILFVNMCKKFVNSPRENYFEKERLPVKISEIKKSVKERGTEMIMIKFKRPDIVDDVLFAQLRKTSKRLDNFLGENEFRVIKRGSWADENICLILLEMEVWNLPGIRKMIGPSIFSKIHSEQFTKKYGNGRLDVEKDYWISFVERKFLTAKEALSWFVGKSKKKLREQGIGSHLSGAISLGRDVKGTKDIILFAEKEKKFSFFLRDFLEGNI